MNQSESIKELAAALAKAQGEMSHASKDSKNPHFNSKYADLASVLDACREPLSKNGLSVTQVPARFEMSWVLKTRLMHSSGEWLESEIPILTTKNDAQGFGSGLTYARRYSLAAMVGVAQDDDDGNAASAQKPPGQPAPKIKPAGPPPGSFEEKQAKARAVNNEAKERKPVDNQAPISQADAKALFEISKTKNITPEQMSEIIKGIYDLDSSKDLKVFQFVELSNLLTNNSIDEIGQIIVEAQAERHFEQEQKEELK